MKKLSKRKSTFNPLEKKEKHQGSRTNCRIVRGNLKKLETLPIKEKCIFRKGKKLGSLIDKWQISAGDYEKICKILNSTPDTRSEKVLSLKKAILQGYYQIKSQAIAEKILKEIIFELH